MEMTPKGKHLVATQHLWLLKKRRAMWEDHQMGCTLQEIAEHAHLPEGEVIRTFAWLNADILETTPSEIIHRAYKDHGDRGATVAALRDFTYTFSGPAPEPLSGRTTGSWGEVERACSQGFLSPEELEQIKAAVGPAA